VAEEATSFTPWSASDELRRSHEFNTLAAAEFTSRISVARFPWGLYTRDVKLTEAWGHSILKISIATARGRHSCRWEQPRPMSIESNRRGRLVRVGVL